MKSWWPKAGLAAALMLALATPGLAQQKSNDDLAKEMEAMRQMLLAIQKDLQEVKGMLARQAPPPSGVGTVLDLGGAPVKGEKTAKLTLVEFSDYQ
jgi:protein-disulfide isomerase